MCIVALAWQVVPDRPLVLLGNRDEFYHRPAAPLALWADQPIIAGQDLQSGGAWLGMTPIGRWAVITNYREKIVPPADAVTRGALITDYLTSDLAPLDFLQTIDNGRYAGFNLIVGTLSQAAVLSNRGTPAQALAPGLHTLSNAQLDTPWPKTRRLRTGFESLDLSGDIGTIETAGLMLLNDQTRAPDAELPETGVGLALEQVLSPIRIESPVYGTRVSSVLVLASTGYDFIERTWHPEDGGTVRLQGQWTSAV